MPEFIDHFLDEVIARADDLIAAIDGTTDQFELETAGLSEAVSALQTALAERKLGFRCCSVVPGRCGMIAWQPDGV